jgi:hypothetical protein
MKLLSGIMLAVCFLGGSLAVAQDKSKAAPMMKNAMAAKKMIMEPKAMESARMMMMDDKSMVPMMVAKEMMQQEMMHDKDVMGMVEKGTMKKPSDDMMMMNDKHVEMATEKMMADPAAMQMLFQELVARHIASKKMKMMMEKPDGKMMSMAGKEMKAMMMDEESVMMAKKEMMSSEESAMMMAHESLVHSLMQDKEVMAMVEKAARMKDDPKMAPMMSDEKMKMASDAMMKDKEQMKGMMHSTMMRQMIDGKQKVMKGDIKKK